MNPTLQWHPNGRDGVSNHQPHQCLLNCLFGHISKTTSKLRVSGLCAGNSPGPVNSPHKWQVKRKMFPFDDIIMKVWSMFYLSNCHIDGLVQERCNSSALAMELRLSCINPQICNDLDWDYSLHGDYINCKITCLVSLSIFNRPSSNYSISISSKIILSVPEKCCQNQEFFFRLQIRSCGLNV